MAETTAAATRFQPLRDKKRVRVHIMAELGAAMDSGRLRRVRFLDLRTIGQAVADVFAEATDDEHKAFLADTVTGDGDGTTLETIKARVIEKTGGAGGPLIDIITQLLPILLPMLLACFGA